MRFQNKTLLVATVATLLAACGAPAAPAAPAAKTDANAAAPAQSSGGAVQLNGSGATFPQPLYEDWAFAYSQTDTSVKINYSGGGSGQGKKDIIASTVDFAGSDAKLTDEEFGKAALQQIPTVAGAVVLAYNIEGVTDPLVLDNATIGGIFVGKIEKWNDAAIAKLNPTITLPDLPINVVHRSDGSGTTNIFTLFLTAASEDWKSTVNPSAGSTVDWPVDKLKRGQGGKGNQGVAAAIQKTKGAIGYVELAFAKNNKMAYAKQVNVAGKTVDATPESVTEAIKDAQFSDRLTTDIVNSKQEGAWPIAGVTYLIVNKDYKDCAKAEKLLKFWNWALTDADAKARAAKQLYSVLPDDALAKSTAALKSITCNGAAVLK